jgi:hypothetical protein
LLLEATGDCLCVFRLRRTCDVACYISPTRAAAGGAINRPSLPGGELDQGHIIERGTHRELLTATGKYAQFYQQFVMHIE